MNKPAFSDPHPMQPLYFDLDREPGTIRCPRFKGNAIVRALLDTGKLNMNDICNLNFPQEDREQFLQLIGYDLCGFCEMSQQIPWNPTKLKPSRRPSIKCSILAASVMATQ